MIFTIVFLALSVYFPVIIAQLIRMEKNDENLPYGVVISGVLKRGDSRYVMIRKRHAKDLIENAVVATDSYSKTERIKHMYDGISCVVETDIRKCIEKLDASVATTAFSIRSFACLFLIITYLESPRFKTPEITTP